jgi:ribosomal protein S18 acetylase RimI-like enzyme
MRKYKFALCTENDIPAINQLMENIDLEISNPYIFVKDDETFIQNHISKKGFTIKASINHKMVAFLIVRYPKKEADNLGKDVRIDPDEYDNIAHIESVVVVPKHRGNKLMFKLLKRAEKELLKQEISYSLATVSPKNKYSLINFLKRDYVVRKLKKKYNGVERLILFKTL